MDSSDDKLVVNEDITTGIAIRDNVPYNRF